MQLFKDRVGDLDTEEGKKFLEARSPLTHVDKIKRAAADRPGRERSARQAGRGRPDRQGDAGAQDSGDLRAVPGRRARLRPAGKQPGVLRRHRGVPGEHLGGRYEPIGDAFDGSTITVPTGAE